MDAIKQLTEYTVEDIYALPEGERAELIDGEIYMMATPSRIHQEMVHFFDRTIGNYIQSHNGDCKVYPAPFAVFLNRDNRNYFEPDISVICDKSKLTDKGCNGAPDWVIEIVSPSSRSMDYYKKLLKYRSSGVREYWVADYEKNQLLVYHFKEDEMTYYTFADKVKVGIYEDFTIDLTEIDVE